MSDLAAAARRTASPFGTPAAKADDIRPLVLVTLVALAVRLIAYFLQPGLTYDGTYYLRQAERLSHLTYDFVSFPPGYPIAALLLRLVVQDLVLAGRLVSLLSGTLSVTLTYILARRHLAPRLALVAALVMALHPEVARISVETLSEALYLSLTLAGVLAFETRKDLLAGGLMGYAFLVRPEAALLMVGLAALRALGDRRFPRLLSLGFVPIVAYSLLASRAVGHPVLSPKQGQFDLGPQLSGRLLTILRSLHATFPVLLVPLAVWIGATRYRHLLFPVLYLLSLPCFAIHIQERLYVPALPFLVLLSLLGWVALKPLWRMPVAVASLALFVLGTAPKYRQLLDGVVLTPHAREIGLALRPQLKFEDRVAGRFPFVAYYAGAGFIRAPRGSAYPSLRDSVSAVGATHLLVLEGEIRDVLPQLRPLFEDARFAASDGRLRQVAWVDRPVGSRAILYRLQPPPIGPENVRVEGEDVDATTWLGDAIITATRRGELRRGVGALLPGNVAGGSQPSADSEGRRVALVQEANFSRWIAVLDVTTSVLTQWPETAVDRPAWPTWVGEEIVYVRQAAPGGLRVLDSRTGRVRDVILPGVGPTDAAPLFVTCQDKQLAITYQPARQATADTRVVATASWPQGLQQATLELTGRWATEVRLFDDVVAWLPDGEHLLASVSVQSTGDTPDVRGEIAALCVLAADGALRRLSFGLDRPRRPSARHDEVAFVSGDGHLTQVTVTREQVQTPPIRVFAPAPDGGAPSTH